MAEEILVTPERLDDEADQLNKHKADHDQSLAELDKVVDGLLQYWRGEAQDAFANSFRAKRKTFEDFSVELETFVKYLKEFAMLMRDQEKLQTAKAAALG